MTVDQILRVSLVLNAILVVATALSFNRWAVWFTAYEILREESRNTLIWAKSSENQEGKNEILTQWNEHLKKTLDAYGEYDE